MEYLLIATKKFKNTTGSGSDGKNCSVFRELPTNHQLSPYVKQIHHALQIGT